MVFVVFFFVFFFNDTATTEIYTLSLHDALPISILTLGYIGVHLRYIQGQSIVDSVVQIFQQRFCSPPSALDPIIVDQLVAIIAAGCVSI